MQICEDSLQGTKDTKRWENARSAKVISLCLCVSVPSVIGWLMSSSLQTLLPFGYQGVAAEAPCFCPRSAPVRPLREQFRSGRRMMVSGWGASISVTRSAQGRHGAHNDIALTSVPLRDILRRSGSLGSVKEYPNRSFIEN